MVQAHSLNSFDVPLPSREVAQIAKSVARWTWREIKPITQAYIEKTHTSEAQKARVLLWHRTIENNLREHIAFGEAT